MNDYNYSRFEKIGRPQIFCPNSCSGYVTDGSLVVYHEHYVGGSVGHRFGRVLGRVTRHADGSTPTEDTLAVLALADNMTFAYMRYVKVADVIEARTQKGFGATLLFVLFGETPSPEEVLRACNYGAMSDSYITEYLRGDKLVFAEVRDREKVGA